MKQHNKSFVRRLSGVKNLGGKYVMGYDPGTPSGDYGVVAVWEKPSKIRRILRKLKIDRSTWEYKLHSEEFIK